MPYKSHARFTVYFQIDRLCSFDVIVWFYKRDRISNGKIVNRRWCGHARVPVGDNTPNLCQKSWEEILKTRLSVFNHDCVLPDSENGGLGIPAKSVQRNITLCVCTVRFKITNRRETLLLHRQTNDKKQTISNSKKKKLKNHILPPCPFGWLKNTFPDSAIT